jgi:hypothetical protein
MKNISKATIKRLKKEKEEMDYGIWVEGHFEGFSWAEEARYSEIQTVLEWDPNMDPLPQGECLDDIGDYFDTVFSHTEYLDNDDFRYSRNNHNNTVYMVGWKEGVEFWDMLKDSIVPYL